MKRLLIYMVVCCAVSQIQAQKQSGFDRAKTNYADGDYQAAIDNYNTILNKGKTSTALYFNMGNAYFKNDQLAQSIYYYNKALQLSPQDADVHNNLAIAKERTVDAIEETPKTGWLKFIDNLTSFFDFNNWALGAVFCTTAVMVFAIAYYFTATTWRKRLFFSLSIVALIVAAVSVSLAYYQYNAKLNRKFAIVFAQKVDVYAEPNTNSSQAFTLHEGTKVKVLDDFNTFVKIQLTDGKQGWIKNSAVKKL